MKYIQNCSVNYTLMTASEENQYGLNQKHLKNYLIILRMYQTIKTQN